jgi:anhydro-N-acetylmuramic acid kinase
MSGQLYLGAISGTSVDGLDLALVEFTDKIRIIQAATVAMPDDLRQSLLELGQSSAVDLDRFGRTDAALGEFIAHALLQFLSDTGYAPASISAIGSHGQTVRHRPVAEHPFTLQIGDPNRIAEITAITTVADFRRRDVAAGGQGAPLVPTFHEALFRHPSENRAVLNLGGIGNFTLLPADPGMPIVGFDTGPANALLDDWVLHKRQQRYDSGGDWAASGAVDEALLARLMTDPYLSTPPPKSTGREHFNLNWLSRHLEQHLENRVSAPTSDADIQATLCAFTAASAAKALADWGPGTQRVLVCGGGRHNRTLLAGLAARIPCPIETTDDHGIDGDSLEAAAFAWLAHQTLNGLPGSAPSVTGASGARVLGAIYGR